MSWLSALANIGTSIWSASRAKKGAEQANEQQYRMFKESMDFSERMDNTKIQRRVKDMTAAGINPVLAVQGGMSSASPSGGSPASTQNVDEAFGKLQLAHSSAMINKVKAETALIRSQTGRGAGAKGFWDRMREGFKTIENAGPDVKNPYSAKNRKALGKKVKTWFDKNIPRRRVGVKINGVYRR